ncbi:MAG: ABC transporter substrate-binding protein [Xanthobacter sp.]
MVRPGPGLSRRMLLRGGLAGVASLLPWGADAADAGRPDGRASVLSAPEIAAPRIVAMDFGLAETLIEMGAPPVAVPNPASWADWVVEPPLPATVVNLGTDREPNLELLATLKPDLIVTTPYLAAIRPVLERFAPTRTFSIYAPPGGHPFDLSIAATRDLAALIARPEAGEALIARAEETMAQAKRQLEAAGAGKAPLMVVSFLDANHARIYGAGSLFGDVMTRCGLDNGWTRHSNYWGFNTVGIEALAQNPTSRLLYLEPVSPDTLRKLDESPLWNSLPFVQAGHVQRLPPVLMFGMLPSAMRFARQLVRHLAPDAGEGGGHG